MAPHANADVTPEILIEEGIQHTLSQTASLPSKSIRNGGPHLPDLDASLLQTTLNPSPRAVPGLNSPERSSQSCCTDHMITCNWSVSSGWSAPRLHAYGPLSLMPTASCLHYATECFEGMKLYRGFDGSLRLFRPSLNCRRMLMSATRIALPGFPPEELLKLIVKLAATDGAKWLPRDEPGRFLYVRPTMVASDPALGVQKPREAMLFVILCVFSSLSTSGGGTRLLASRDDMVRAWPGGFGFAKVGANYGPTLLCQGEARARGFDQILWLFGPNSLVTEAGASNFFVVVRSKSSPSTLQLITGPLTDRIILDGVTRRSVLELARSRLSPSSILPENVEPLEVHERQFTMAEVAEAYAEGRLVEAFAAGTAWFVAGVQEIEWKGQTIRMQVDGDGGGVYATLLKEWLKNIMYGKENHEWGYVIEEE